MPYPLKKLGELFEITSSKRVFKSEWKSEGIPFYRAREIVKLAKNGFVDNDLFITEKMFHEYSEKYGIPKENDIMVTGVGTLGICYLVKNDDKFYFKDGNIIWLKHIGKEVDSRYIEYGFQSEIIKKQVNQTTGTSVGTYTIIRAKNTKIPLPPLPTQKAIVQKLDEAFASIDASIELAEKNLKEIDEGNASVLEEVFGSGQYEEKSVEQISENIQYGYTGKTTSKGKVRYLRITDIQNNTIYWENVPFVEIEEREISKYSLNCGDIVFARTGATVGKSCLIDENGIGNIFASYLIRIVSKLDLIFPEYLQYFFYSHKYWEQIGLDVVGAAQPNFNGTKLKQIKLPLPPLSKQKEIVEYLDQVFAVNAELKRAYEEKIHSLKELKQSLLRGAFEGRLVRE